MSNIGIPPYSQQSCRSSRDSAFITFGRKQQLYVPNAVLLFF
ncbi:hypothetical protein FOXYSP1_19473 [Fusarium oxysporum f. sp. phaseoli]